MRDLHIALAWVTVGANAVAGAWALAAHRWPALRHRTLWWAVAVAEVVLLAEVAVGVALQVRLPDGADVDQFHAFYGFVAFATVGIAFSYRAQLRPWRFLLYGGTGLFLMGLALRAMQFGGVSAGP